MSEIDKEPFDKAMDEELLKNDFAYYDDWEYGPMTGWQQPWEYYVLKLMKHDYGYNLIIGRHGSGENPKMGIGSSNNAAEIIAIRDALKKLW